MTVRCDVAETLRLMSAEHARRQAFRNGVVAVVVEALVNYAGKVTAVMTTSDQRDDGGRGAAVTGLLRRRWFIIGAVCQQRSP
jgi:hypothetical protein